MMSLNGQEFNRTSLVTDWLEYYLSYSSVHTDRVRNTKGRRSTDRNSDLFANQESQQHIVQTLLPVAMVLVPHDMEIQFNHSLPPSPSPFPISHPVLLLSL